MENFQKVTQKEQLCTSKDNAAKTEDPLLQKPELSYEHSEKKETLAEAQKAVKESLETSKLINAQGREFILKALDSPKKVQLLFRASEHQFSARQFHKYCDNIPHNITLIRTDFGKIIAGYTPLPWKPGDDDFGIDPSGKTFLLSVDLKEKMTLINKEEAIFYRSKLGPCFGIYGNDIYIRDSCPAKNIDSSFPTSYNCQGKYQKNQFAWSSFYGCPEGIELYRVTEYEVYQIIWQ